MAGKNPYQSKKLFASTPVQNVFSNATVQFIVKSELYYTNLGKTVTAISVDMGNGSGFRAVTWDNPFSVTYSSSGIKSFIIKYTFSDGDVLQTHGRIAISIDAIPAPSKAGGYSLFDNNTLKQTFKAESSHSGGEVTVAFGKDHTDKKLRKPFIVAEGFDPWKIMSTKNMTILDFMSDDFYNRKMGAFGVPLYANSSATLLNYLYDQGYDIVYLDYKNGTDDIRRNAVLLEEVIQWVNDQKKSNGSPESNVVMGISMGGLVARYALRQLEIQRYDHQTKIFFSVDSPHNGANVPVGIQAALYHAKDFAFVTLLPLPVVIHPANYVDEIGRSFDLLNTMAAKQMLIYKVSKNSSGGLCYDNSAYQTFMVDLQSKGFPERCYNVAISDGAGNGNPQFPAGSKLIEYSESYKLNAWMEALSCVFNVYFFFTSIPELALFSVLPGSSQVKMEVSIKAIPSDPDNVYHGHVYVRKKILWFIPVNVNITKKNFNSTSAMLPVDGAPGGKYDISQFDFGESFSDAIKEGKFCFVPTVSALAFNDWKANLNSNFSSYDLVAGGYTNFQDYYRQMPTANNLHTSFYTSDYSLANYIKGILDNSSSYCTSSTTLQNMDYSKNQTITGCNLTIQNCSVRNNCNVVFDPTYNTSIEGTFEVQLGSSIEIK